MLRYKHARFFALFLTVVGALSLLTAIIPSKAVHAADLDPNASVSRINRSTLRVGGVFFYDRDTTTKDANGFTFNAIGTDCPASIVYRIISTESSIAETWTLNYQKKNNSGNDCGAKNTKNLSKPSNWTERQYVVFAGGSSDGKYISVQPDNSTEFKKGGTYNGDTVYIQQGVDAYSCPLVIVTNSRSTALIPLEQKKDEASVSNQVRTLFDKELGVDDTACGPTDNDDLGIFKQFGLPESYYDAGSEKDHYETTDFGFDGDNVGSATIYVESISAASGIAAVGPLEGGGYDASVGTDDSEGGDGVGAESSCAIDGIGWIVCPVMTFLADINDKAFGFLEGLLGIRPALIQDEGTMSAWSTFRDLANVMFVIAFMVVVYSQLTSAGVSNYGIKKMLPKVVVAAILVNLSYFICAIMVDISNIAGSSIYSLMETIGQNAVSGGDKVGGAGNTWSDIVGGLLMAGVGVLLIVALIMAPTVLLALAIVLLILIARQALIIILIIASPIAFVAYLLPNTEDWFKRWWKAFVATLMVYPIVGLVFGGSMLVANILMGISGDGGEGGDDEQLLKIVALAVMAIPLFTVPAILKGSLSAMGSIGTRLQGYADKSQGMAARQGKKRLDNTAFMRGRNFRKQAKEQFKNNKFAEAVSGTDTSRIGRLRRRAAGGITGRTFTDSGDYAQQSMVAQAQITADKNYEDQVRGAALNQVNLTNAQVAAMTRTGMDANGRKLTQHELAAANDRVMKTGSFDERREAIEYLAANKGDKEHGSESLRNRAVQGAYSRGDQNIYGAGFGNEVVSATGGINGAGDLMKATVDNAKSGKVSQEHIVQGEASSKYLVNSVTDVTHGDATAKANIKAAAKEAKVGDSTKAKYTSAMDSHYGSL